MDVPRLSILTPAVDTRLTNAHKQSRDPQRCKGEISKATDGGRAQIGFKAMKAQVICMHRCELIRVWETGGK